MIRIAIVDDHEIIREGLKSILQCEPDFEVVAETETAEELGELVENAKPHIVLLDARLPGIGGAEACRRLVAAHPEVAVLMVSSYSDDQLVEECISAGAKGYLIKDIEQFSLKESIRAVARGQGAVSPVIAGKILARLRIQEESPSRGSAMPLSETQLEIVRLIAAGLSNREIASRVRLSENTVKSHIQGIFRKLGVGNRVEAALTASREGWL